MEATAASKAERERREREVSRAYKKERGMAKVYIGREKGG